MFICAHHMTQLEMRGCAAPGVQTGPLTGDQTLVALLVWEACKLIWVLGGKGEYHRVYGCGGEAGWMLTRLTSGFGWDPVD